MPNVGLYIYIYIYTTLAFLALLGAPYIYEISSLRVKAWNFSFDGMHAVAHARTRTYTFTRNSNRTQLFKTGALFLEDWFIARNMSLIKVYIF